MPFVRVAAVSELPDGELIEVVHNGSPVAVCRVAGQVHAVSGVCPHPGGPLGQGALEGGMITCPWHAWPFDLKTGACALNGEVRIPVYSVRVTDSDVFVELP